MTSGWLLTSCGRRTRRSLYFSSSANTCRPFSSDRVIDEPEAKSSLPASNRSKVESCSTSEYMVRPLNGPSIRPASTALAMVPMPAWIGIKRSVRRPAAISALKKSVRWPAMAAVSSSGGWMVEALSCFSVMTMATIFSGGMAIAVAPMRSLTFMSGIGSRCGRCLGMKTSCRPSSAGDCERLISTITLSARIAKLALLPTEVVGMMAPVSVIAIASMMATSTGASWRVRSSSTVSDRCWSVNMTSPRLIAARKVGSVWKGMRRASAPAWVSAASVSPPSEAPVIRVIASGALRARSASASGTALASPARVKPLVPTVMPSWIHSAARSALVMRSRSCGRRTRSWARW